ncbi:amino acid adenylation domain-containing protein [Nostoc sp. CENA67]|uniref:Amino acid adenylation domain-containing protein n=1 Tax=Amazonocrinis nigriterrae CENA67 TaxID=2794033 RepID=A0A8J7HQZ6_9NOST|nr:non-ribosomal peptide synthetase [Amazonocrinis nigriterrae]MBH8561812.1 amino acid adenylation domain-containing protein [Amazonocrinis nigriterrae CENA67]
MQNITMEGFQLSPQQEHLWLLQKNDKNFAYRIDSAILIEGNCNISRLELALQKVIHKYEILRTCFRCLPEMSIPIQVINNSTLALNQKHNLSDYNPDQQAAQIELLFQQLHEMPFDLDKGLILHIYLVNISSEKNLLFISLPAICADTVSLQVLVKEIADSYSDEFYGQLSDELLQYADYSEWQNQILESEETKIGRKFWIKEAIDNIKNLNLPHQKKVNNQDIFLPENITLLISSEVTQKIDILVQKYNISANIFYLTCWLILLQRLSGETKIIVNTGVDGRKYDELKGALGLFAKYLPLYSDLEDNSQFVQLLQQIDEAAKEIYEWEEYFTWEDNTKKVDSSFCFDWQEEYIKYSVENLHFSIYKQYNCIDKFKLKLSCRPHASEVIAEFSYNSTLFDVEDIKGIAEQFQKLVESAANNPEARICDLEILSDRTLHQLLFEFNQTQTDYPANKCIHQLFAEQVERTPNNIAVAFNNQQLTYAELNARANKLAQYLQKLGVGAEVLVGICVERSLEMVVGILGILKAGGAYVPLDPHYPQERLAFMLQDTQLSILLTQQHLLEGLPNYDVQTICLDTQWQAIAQESPQNLLVTATPENLAYVIYTSGSTGKPKGVEITHRNLVNSTTARISYYQEPVSSFLLLSSFAFDSSVAGIFWTLCCGGTLHLPAEGVQREVTKLVELLSQHHISHLLSLPSLYALILQQAKREQLTSLRTVIVAGEACAPEIVEHHLQLQLEASLFNEYGPTEATVWSSVYSCNYPKIRTQVSIGRPIDNTQIYILDSHLHPVPIGVAGEVYISGEGLARGYLNQSTITSEKFIPHPFSQKPGMRLYQTGDLARYLNDGNIEFLGRIDNQVKIRGFRIEIGEIEALLNQHPQVQETVAIAREDVPGNKRLVAYVIPQLKSATTVNEIRNFLKEKLPEFMVPSAVVLLKELPLSSNGKVDRKALPSPEQVRSDLRGEFVPPRTFVEEMLAQIWAEVLKLDQVGIYDNFFELGGHSLLTTQLLAKLKENFNCDISLRSLLENPTVAGLAEKLEKSCPTEVENPRLDIKSETVLDSTIYPQTVGKFIPEPSSILLTGATGFLGVFLLAELLQQTKADIYCLVRSKNIEYSHKKLQNILEAYGIWNELWSDRIITIVGDLSKPFLGLEMEKFQQLASTIDVIYHNGAWVHHIYPYSILKPTNVLGTQEILRLASHNKTKPVHFISSSGVVSSKVESGVKLAQEQDKLNDNEFPNNGYSQTKWVAEKLVQTAAERGITISIYRPSRISGHSQTGVYNSNDFLYKLIIGCIQLGSAPDTDIRDNIVPVDYVSKAIVYLSNQEKSLGKTFHLVHPQTLHSHTLIDHIRSLGYAIEQISYNEWREKLLNLTQGSLEHPLYPLVSFFPSKSQEKQTFDSGFLKFDCKNTINGLAGSSIVCPEINENLLNTYLLYLIENSLVQAK